MYEEIDDQMLVAAFFIEPYASENRAKSPPAFLAAINAAALRILDITPAAFDMDGFVRAMAHLPEAEAEAKGRAIAQAIRDAANG